MKIQLCVDLEQGGWLPLRQALWPHRTTQYHLFEMARALASPGRFTQLIAYDDELRNAIGIAEASIRTDYVNGTSSSPVAFLEGIYVVPEMRRTGIARALLHALETWATGAGCIELASDAKTDNLLSHTFHKKLGFEEKERVVCFQKSLSSKHP